MTETFEVGDKVKHEDRGEVEVTYGPFTDPFGNTRYLVKVAEGREVGVHQGTLTAIPEPPKFAVGDTVSYAYGTGGKLVAGPFKSEFHDDPIWVVERPNGTHMTPTENSLTKVAAEIKVGDRVRVVVDDVYVLAGEFIGKTGVVERLNERSKRLRYGLRFDEGAGTPHRTWNVAEVELVDDTYTHDGVTYDLTARYQDRDGDYWSFKHVGDDVRGVCRATNVNASHSVGEYSDTIAEAVSAYGPLTRV